MRPFCYGLTTPTQERKVNAVRSECVLGLGSLSDTADLSTCRPGTGGRRCVVQTQGFGAGVGAGAVPSDGVSLSTASRISLPGLNFTTARGGMRTSFAGAFGLRPILAFRT